jgi:hypothetical protein
MKITIENHGRTMFIDLGHDDVSADEFVETIADLMILMGFHTETIKETLSSYGEELN